MHAEVPLKILLWSPTQDQVSDWDEIKPEHIAERIEVRQGDILICYTRFALKYTLLDRRIPMALRRRRAQTISAGRGRLDPD